MKINLNLLPVNINEEFTIPEDFYKDTVIKDISKVKVNSCCGGVDKMQQPKQLHVKRCEIWEKRIKSVSILQQKNDISS